MIRPALLSDAPVILRLANEHEQAVDEGSEPLTLAEIEQQLRGWSEPGEAFCFEVAGQIQAVALLNNDSARGRCELDLFSQASKENTAELFDYVLHWWRTYRPELDFRTACNQNDRALRELFESRELPLYRIYWKLICDLEEMQPASPNPEVEIHRAILPGDAALLHQLEQRSFSEHFGWKEISLADWIAERNKDDLLDPEGIFIAQLAGTEVGYLICSTNRREINGGFVDKLGVLKEFRSRGVGRALLLTALDYYRKLGCQSVALGVDSGNESGALGLYESCGFRVNVAWSAYRLEALR